jgi:CheY-like chemotaxis protein
MITGYASLDSALRAVREGAYDYLAKPFSLGQLDVMLARIRNLIALERENSDLRRRLAGRSAAGPAPSTAGLRGTAPMPAPPVAPRPAPVAYAPPPPPHDLNNRVGTMEDRLGKIEDMLRSALSAR